MVLPFDPQMLVVIAPELGMLVLAALVLILDLIWHGSDRGRSLGWVTMVGLMICAGLSIRFALPNDQSYLIFGGMLSYDWMAFVFRFIFLFGAAITALFAMDSDEIGKRGEFYLMLIISAFGMSLMAAANNLIMVYLAIETTTIPLFVMAGFLVRDYKSTEGGLKYLLFAAMTSAVMLYGFSLLYGFTGSTQIQAMPQALSSVPKPLVFTALGLVLVGFGFKISAAPFHFWAPDVYEGAPSPVAGFLSTASKAAGFAVLMRVTTTVFPETIMTWRILIAVIAVASMIIGNVLALTQKNIKRLLAYSSIAQAGYMLIGVATITPFGYSATVFYLMAYLVTNLAAFGVVAIVGRRTGSDDISAYAGLSRRSPGLALILLVALLSLGGIPPFGGFIGKLFVFAAAVNAELTWLVVVGVINAIIALYYYLTVLKVVYLYRSEEEAQPLRITAPWGIALALCVVGILVLGTVFGPWFNWSLQTLSVFQ